MKGKSKTFRILHPLFMCTRVLGLGLSLYGKGLSATIIDNFRFLTSWGLNMIFVYFLLQTFNLASDRVKKILLTLIVVLEIVITSLYWTLIHSIKPHFTSVTIFALYFNHIYPLVFALIEFLRVDFQIPTSFCFYILILNCSYFAVNIGFTLGTGTPVYDIVTWKDAISVYFTLFSIVSGYIVFFLIQFVARLKSKFRSKQKE